MQEEVYVKEYMNKEYLDYALYVIKERAIPSLIDGLKPSQRKILWCANDIWNNGGKKTLKVFQLSGRVASETMYHHGNCLDYNTNILLEDGSFISIGEWFDNYPNVEFNVISYDEDKKEFVSDKGYKPRIGSVTDTEYVIEMEDGSIIRCTENHPFLTQRGWIEAKDLKETDDIKTIS